MSFFSSAKTIIQRYKHAWVLLYVLIYIPWFLYLEQHVTTNYYTIHSAIDDYIPFVEYFIIPYALWFAYIALTIGYFFFTDTKGFYRLTAYLFSGMTICLLICTVFPNGLALRPEVFVRDNIWVDMVKTLYQTDTPTNVLPSIHVFNSIVAYIAISRCERLKDKKFIRYGALILSISIVLSTMFLKQHSIIDVIMAGGLALILYPFIYMVEVKKERQLSKQPI